jgi:hypothetical protein
MCSLPVEEHYLRSGVLIAVVMNVAIFWDIHGAVSQKIATFTTTAKRTSNPM